MRGAVKITISVEDPTEHFQQRLLALLAEHAADVHVDTEWTVERAVRYYLSLPLNARRIVKEATIRDGYVPADELREDGDGSLRGHSAALKRAVERGVRNRWWPEGMEAPITPQGPGFGKVRGYCLRRNLVDVFFAAIAEVGLMSQRDALERAVRAGGGIWDAERTVKALAEAGVTVDDSRARQLLGDLADRGLLARNEANAENAENGKDSKNARDARDAKDAKDAKDAAVYEVTDIKEDRSAL
ncbi:hypothetical protein [Streptomyces sp. NBC_01190]|uniref:hypothetical protein n=1 Tax=Streptomyces sp. NBC_01190 TaxID=2903767 RepID=UPI003865F706|nr:hypothetical protein OG519_32035 [Streptomyces sp. NBC_01190]